MNSRIVMVAYKPKAGKIESLKSLLLEHHSTLKTQNLVTDRLPIIMQAADYSFIEVFEWKTEEAIQQAHTNKVVQEMWAKYDEVCEYVPVANITESSSLFSHFIPVF